MYLDDVKGGRELESRVLRLEKAVAAHEDRVHRLEKAATPRTLTVEDNARDLASKLKSAENVIAIRDATIQDQRRTLGELNNAHNEALNDLRKSRSTVANLRGQVRQGSAEANASFIAPALKEMMGGLTAEELYDELKKAQEELHEVKTSRDYWRNIGREQAEQLRGVDGKLKAAEEHATEAEDKLDQVRGVAENVIMDAHTKIAYIRNVVRP